jgi:hypothetical protein
VVGKLGAMFNGLEDERDASSATCERNRGAASAVYVGAFAARAPVITVLRSVLACMELCTHARARRCDATRASVIHQHLLLLERTRGRGHVN